jgi:hypothetical protein
MASAWPELPSASTTGVCDGRDTLASSTAIIEKRYPNWRLIFMAPHLRCLTIGRQNLEVITRARLAAGSICP